MTHRFQNMTKVLLLAPALLITLGCGDDNLPKYWQLGDLRILAVTASAPEVSPGDTVTITPIISDVNGGGRTLSYSAEGCVDPGVGYGADPSCARASDRVSLGSGNITTLSAPNYTGNANAITVTVPATILLGRSAPTQHNGYAYLVTLTVFSADGASVTGFRRIIASTKTPKNANPSLTDLLSNGSTLSALPASAVNLSATVAGGSAESYNAMKDDTSIVSKTESLTVTWFATDGTLEKTRTSELETNSWTPPSSAPAGRNALVIGILRDDRGGVSTVIKTL